MTDSRFYGPKPLETSHLRLAERAAAAVATALVTYSLLFGLPSKCPGTADNKPTSSSPVGDERFAARDAHPSEPEIDAAPI